MPEPGRPAALLPSPPRRWESETHVAPARAVGRVPRRVLVEPRAARAHLPCAPASPSAGLCPHTGRYVQGPRPSPGGVRGALGAVLPLPRAPGLRLLFWNVSGGQRGRPTARGHRSCPLLFPSSFLGTSGAGGGRADSGNLRGWDPGTKILSKSRKSLAGGWGFPSGSEALTARPGPGLVRTFKGTRSCPEGSAPTWLPATSQSQRGEAFAIGRAQPDGDPWPPGPRGVARLLGTHLKAPSDPGY